MILKLSKDPYIQIINENLDKSLDELDLSRVTRFNIANNDRVASARGYFKQQDRSSAVLILLRMKLQYQNVLPTVDRNTSHCPLYPHLSSVIAKSKTTAGITASFELSRRLFYIVVAGKIAFIMKEDNVKRKYP